MVFLSLGSVAPAYLISVSMAVFSVVLGLFSSSIFMVWLSMELSVCSFCGVLSFAEAKGGESVMKYFIASTFSGMALLCSLLLDWSESMVGLDESVLSLIFFICIYTKLGLPPFHFWVVGVLWGCSWFSAFLLLTIQKVLPLMLLSSSLGFKDLVVVVALISALSAGLAGLGHYEPCYVVGYSSMISGNWLVLVSFFSVNILLVSLLFYSSAIFLVLFCLREKSWGNCFGYRHAWLMMAIMFLVGLPNGPVFLMKVIIYQSFLVEGYLVSAWVVAFTSILLIPLYMRILTLVVMGIWGRGVNESVIEKWSFIPLLFSFLVFSFSGFGWSSLNF